MNEIDKRRQSPQFALADIQQMAETVVRSGLFPALKTAEAAAGLMLLCDSEGLHPMQAMRRYDIIQGRPAMRSDAMLAEFQNRGGSVRWNKMDDTECEGVFSAPGLSGDLPIRWTIAMAERAGLTKKDNWRNYPRAMLRARVIGEGVRSAMPGVVVGIYSTEEAEDMGPHDSAVAKAFADAGIGLADVGRYLGRAPEQLSTRERADLLSALRDHRSGTRRFDASLRERLDGRAKIESALATLRIADPEAFTAAAVDSLGRSRVSPGRLSYEQLVRLRDATQATTDPNAGTGSPQDNDDTSSEFDEWMGGGSGEEE